MIVTARLTMQVRLVGMTKMREVDGDDKNEGGDMNVDACSK